MSSEVDNYDLTPHGARLPSDQMNAALEAHLLAVEDDVPCQVARMAAGAEDGRARRVEELPHSSVSRPNWLIQWEI